MCARSRLQGHRVHAGDLRQITRQIVQQLECALRGAGVLVRVKLREMRRRCLVNLGVVFHRATAERVEVLVHAHLTVRQTCVVTHQIKLRDFRQLENVDAQVVRAEQRLEIDTIREAGLRRNRAAPTGFAALKNQRVIIAVLLCLLENRGHELPPFCLRCHSRTRHTPSSIESAVIPIAINKEF